MIRYRLMIVRLLVNYRKHKPNNPRRFTWTTETVEYDMYDDREFLEDLYLSMLAFTEDVRNYHWNKYEELSKAYWAKEESEKYTVEELNEEYSKVTYHSDRGLEGELLPKFYMHEGESYEVEKNLQVLQEALAQDDYSWMFVEKKTMSMPTPYFKNKYFDMSFESPVYIPVKFNHWASVDVSRAYQITQEIELAVDSRVILDEEGREI